ncbi:MAG: hypothetical protein M3O22_00500 [Pseudomonadota bacterium]|nr:hypothetical protein [Pseudomonadota bacterium]
MFPQNFTQALKRKGFLGITLCITATTPACSHFVDDGLVRPSAGDKVTYTVGYAKPLDLGEDKELTTEAAAALVAIARVARLSHHSRISCLPDGGLDLLFPKEISRSTPQEISGDPEKRVNAFSWIRVSGEDNTSIQALCVEVRGDNGSDPKCISREPPKKAPHPHIPSGLYGTIKGNREGACKDYPGAVFEIEAEIESRALAPVNGTPAKTAHPSSGQVAAP